MGTLRTSHGLASRTRSSRCRVTNSPCVTPVRLETLFSLAVLMIPLLISRLIQTARQHRRAFCYVPVGVILLDSRRFPSMPSCVGRRGGRYTNCLRFDGRIGFWRMACRWNPNLYFDLTGATLKCKSARFLGDLLWWTPTTRYRDPLKRHAWEKIVFGTDVPAEEMGDVLADYRAVMRELGLSTDLQDKVLGGTLARLLKL